jgi:hypothetical protein
MLLVMRRVRRHRAPRLRRDLQLDDSQGPLDSRPDLRVALRREVAEARENGLDSHARAHPEGVPGGEPPQRRGPRGFRACRLEKAVDRTGTLVDSRKAVVLSRRRPVLFEN